MDAHKNFAYSTVATAPSPATTGTSLVVQSGDGALFPAVPFNVTIWPAGEQPLDSNAEIVRVTGISTDTFTIDREEEGTSARTIVAGDQIAATITSKTIVDVETAITDLAAQGATFWDDTIIKQSDESVTSSATLQDDNELQFPIDANVPYYFELFLVYTSGSGTPDIKHAFAMSSGTFTRAWRNHDGGGPTTFVAQSAVVVDMTTVIVNATTSQNNVVRVTGTVEADTTATVKLQWAQNTSDGTATTVKAGSLIRYRKLTRLTP